MEPRMHRTSSRLAPAVLLACALAQPALALQEEPLPPPQPNRQLTLVTPVIGYAVMALATAALVGVSLLKSRRGAQD